MQKKFISIIRGYHKQIFSFDKEQNYHMLPLEAMKELWYNCEIFAINSQTRIEDDPNFVKWVNVIYYKNFFQYIKYLLDNRTAIIYSNTLTIKTLLVWIFGRKTIFIPHDSIFWSNKIKEIIIKFFYRFFRKIRLNNWAEVQETNKIRKNLWVKIPLVVSGKFYNSNFNFDKENIFISLGNLIPKKHPELILQALKIVKDKGYNFRLKVIGEDRLARTYWYTYKDLIKKYKLESEIEMLWFVSHSDLPKCIEWACLYLNASTQEWLCLAVYESVLMWLQTILPNILSFDQVFWENGLYYQQKNVNDFADKIIYFINHRESFVQKIKKTQNLILKDYNYNSIKLKLQKLFLSIK